MLSLKVRSATILSVLLTGKHRPPSTAAATLDLRYADSFDDLHLPGGNVKLARLFNRRTIEAMQPICSLPRARYAVPPLQAVANNRTAVVMGIDSSLRLKRIIEAKAKAN